MQELKNVLYGKDDEMLPVEGSYGNMSAQRAIGNSAPYKPPSQNMNQRFDNRRK